MLQKHPSKNPLRGLICEATFFYTDTIPTGFKRGLKDPKFPIKARFGWETEPTGPGAEVVIFFKIDTYGSVRNARRIEPTGPGAY